MRKHAQASFSYNRDVKSPSNRNPSLSTTLQQRRRIFQIDYLFGQPNIKRFQPHQNRSNNHKNTTITSKTTDFTTKHTTQEAEKLQKNTMPIKDKQKNAKEMVEGVKSTFHVDKRGENIHSKKSQCRIRTRSSLKDDRSSEVTLKKCIKNTQSKRLTDSSNLIIAHQPQNYPFISVCAQGVTYSQKTPRQLKKSQNSEQKQINIEKSSCRKTEKAKILIKGMYRPWSPQRYNDILYFGIQDVIY